MIGLVHVDKFLSKTVTLNFDFLQVLDWLQGVDKENIGDRLAPTWAGYRTVKSFVTYHNYSTSLMLRQLTEVLRACLRLRTRCRLNCPVC